ncbi:dTDP-4-dehydrorhamnose reductase [Mucilaginibacter gracilis]|uniref:dTDP-4-dehydrorhamnose reductase n=1 Tax=Mucilaginibacter gracilis TaxID=423350 RepID=A0A495J008_9SPHI|nr:dTDP-4-dehydrorhamnose reductase [Mucilaginibacter gracilis]RKR82267.1 dTDP-4-dehydrorhamnose reductase [Mucilaginibacter gracilis]
MNKVIVMGASGQLGQCLRSVSGQYPDTDVIFPGEGEANVLDIYKLEELFKHHLPQYCINCAAYTAVDKAESDQVIAGKVNKEGPQNLAELCNKYNAVLIHISTDFVFSGNHHLPYSEDDVPAPINVYGVTKLEGEQVIASSTSKFFIIRTSWLYSEFGNNFVKTMLRLGREKTELKVVADQIGTPTYGVDLAHFILKIVDSGSESYGIYHYSNEGVASWYDFAKAIFEISEIDILVYPVRSSEFITAAQRPSFSVMDKSKARNEFKLNIPYWRESLVGCVTEIN